MERTIAAFTIFTFLLFAVSAALEPAVLRLSDHVHKPSAESTTVADKPKSALDGSTANYQLPEPEKTQTFDVSTIDSTPRLKLSRSLPIQRHYFDRTSRIPLRFVRRHPCRKFKRSFMIPTKRTYGNDMILSDKSTSVDLETIGDQMPIKWLEFKHKYGHRHHHYHHDKDEKFESKYEFDRESSNSISGHRKEKKEHKGGFMRRVRKFLKHTFD